MPGLYDEVLAAGGWGTTNGFDLPGDGEAGYISPVALLGGISGIPGLSDDGGGGQYVSDYNALNAWMQQNGYQYQRWDQPGSTNRRVVDAQGRVVGTPYYANTDDSTFWTGALAAGALAGGAIYGAGPGVGAGAGAGAGTGAPSLATGASAGAGATGAIGSTGLQASWFAPEGLSAVTGSTGVATGAAGITSRLGSLGARDWINIGSGLYGLSRADDIADRSDPFAQYRGYYGQRLMELENNPSLVTRLPGWQAGLEAIQRQMGAQGYLGSGNHSAALSRYAGDFTNQTLARYATLAGAGQTPGAGQAQAADLTGRSLASIGYGLAPLFPRIGG